MKKVFLISIIPLLFSCSHTKVKSKENVNTNPQRVENVDSLGKVNNGLLFSGCDGFTVFGSLDDEYFLVMKSKFIISNNEKIICESGNCNLLITIEKKKKGIYYSNPCSDIVYVNSPKPNIIEVSNVKLTNWIEVKNGLKYFNCEINQIILKNKRIFKNVNLYNIPINSTPG